MTGELQIAGSPIASRDVVTAVAYGQQEAATDVTISPLSSDVTVEVDTSGESIGCTSNACQCCNGALGYVASLIAGNPAFEQPKWRNLKELLKDQRPAEPAFSCPSVVSVLKELVDVSSEITLTAAPVTELRELEKRLKIADAEVLQLRITTERLQKLLDRNAVASRHRVNSDTLSLPSVNSASVISWLDLANSTTPFTFVESESRQTGASSRHVGESESEAENDVTNLIALRKRELDELRADTVNWDSKHNLIREKVAEIEALEARSGRSNVHTVTVLDASDEDTSTATPRQYPSSPAKSLTIDEIADKVTALQNELTTFVNTVTDPEMFEEKQQDRLVEPVSRLSATLEKSLDKLSRFAKIVSTQWILISLLRLEMCKNRSVYCSLGLFNCS